MTVLQLLPVVVVLLYSVLVGVRGSLFREVATPLTMPTTPPQLEALVTALPKLSEDLLRTVLEASVARLKVRPSVPRQLSISCAPALCVVHVAGK